MFHDTVEVLVDSTMYAVPAYVGNSTSAQVDTAGALIGVNAVRAMVPLPLYDPATGEDWPITPEQVTAIRWRSKRWDLDGPPMISRVRGEDHHATWKLTTT